VRYKIRGGNNVENLNKGIAIGMVNDLAMRRTNK